MKGKNEGRKELQTKSYLRLEATHTYKRERNARVKEMQR
jgi:hypothetical protein